MITQQSLGPRIVARLTCDGCPALKTKYWSEALENDETDSGTRADCEEAGLVISHYWHESDATHEWCPHIKAAMAAISKLKGGA